jgi:hypothetical protein
MIPRLPSLYKPHNVMITEQIESDACYAAIRVFLARGGLTGAFRPVDIVALSTVSHALLHRPVTTHLKRCFRIGGIGSSHHPVSRPARQESVN